MSRHRLGERRTRRHVVAVGVDVHLVQLARDLAGQRVELADRVDLVAEQADAPGAVLVVRREDVHRLAAQPERAALERGVVAAVLLLGQGTGQRVALDLAAHFQLDDHARVGLDRADAVDAGHGGDDDHVVALQQALRRRVAHAVDRLVDLAVLLHVGVGARHVGFRLVVVVVADEVLDRVVREELLHLAIELRRQRLVRRQDQRRALRVLDQLGHGERLAGAGDAQQHLVPLRRLHAGPQVADGGRLVAGGLVVADHAGAAVTGLAGCRCGSNVTVPTRASRLLAPLGAGDLPRASRERRGHGGETARWSRVYHGGSGAATPGAACRKHPAEMRIVTARRQPVRVARAGQAADAVLRAAFPVPVLPARAGGVPGWCGGGPAARRRAAGGQPVLLSVERAALRPRGAGDLRGGLRAGQAGRARQPGGAGGGRADQPWDAGLLQIHRLRGGQPGRAAGAAGLRPWHVGQVALPIGVSFIVFEKITYLVDIAPRPQPPGAGLRHLPALRVPVPQAARRPDHQVPRAGGAARGGRARPRRRPGEGSAASCWAW